MDKVEFTAVYSNFKMSDFSVVLPPTFSFLLLVTSGFISGLKMKFLEVHFEVVVVLSLNLYSF